MILWMGGTWDIVVGGCVLGAEVEFEGLGKGYEEDARKGAWLSLFETLMGETGVFTGGRVRDGDRIVFEAGYRW
jgi:hypothetical protein